MPTRLCRPLTAGALLLGGSLGLAVSVPSADAGAAGTACTPLGPAGSLNVFTAGTATIAGEHDQAGAAFGGRVDASGDADLFAVGATTAPSTVTLVAGAAFNAGLTPGSVKLRTGSFDYVGPLTGTVKMVQVGSVAKQVSAGMPFAFAAAVAELAAASSTINQLAPNGTVGISGTTLKLTGQQQGGANVFDITAAQLAAAATISLDITYGRPTLINVSGPSFTGAGQTFKTGSFPPDDVLINFPTATSVSLTNDAMRGSVLAPGAALSASGLTGPASLWVASGTMTNDHLGSGTDLGLFTGCIPLLPPPSTPEAPLNILLPLSALGVAGGALVVRRLRSDARA